MQLNILVPVLVLSTSTNVTAHHRKGSNSVIEPDLVNIPDVCIATELELNLKDHNCSKNVIGRFQEYCLDIFWSKSRRRDPFEELMDKRIRIAGQSSEEKCQKQVDEYIKKIIITQKYNLASKKKASKR